MSDRPDPPTPEPDEGAAPEERGTPVPRRSKRAIIWFALLGIIVIVGSAAAWKADRVQKDPKLCQSCHLGSVHAVAESPHKNQKCSDCHENHESQNLHQWMLGLYSKTKTTPHGKVDRGSCKRCHTSGSTEPWQMARTLGHTQHVLKAEDPLDCDKCHTLKDHKVEPNPDTCAECHKEVKLYGAHSPQELHRTVKCLSCHNYLARVGGGGQTPSHDCRRCHGGVEEPSRSDRFSDVISSKGVPPTQIHGNLRACTLCHNPHSADPAKRSTGAECGRCHRKIQHEFHSSKQPEKFDCKTCHQAHGSREELKTSCQKCHAQKVDQKSTVASRHDRCAVCHKPHEFKATYAGCRDCHKDQTNMLASWKAETHAECTNCHKPHSQKEEDTTCVRCHKKGGHNHKACTTCHDPHKSKTEVKACAACHAGESNALARSVATHRAAQCLTCHQPHSADATKKACGHCHTKQSSLVSSARIDKHQRCVSCHQTHAWSAQIEACRSCHENPTTGAHTGKCNQCHEVHGPPLGKAASCRNCHKDVPQPAGKHQKCDSCHKAAHGQVKPGPCGSCHEPKATLLASWAPKTHGACTQCHEAHRPTSPKDCAQCHGAIATTVKRTPKHRCTGCHDAHQPPKNLWNACSKCHADEVKAVAGRGPNHSECKSCHKQHDVKPPGCTSCHKALAFAHTVKSHANCNDCHDTHKKKLPTRSDCQRCHADKQNHFPNAQNCAGCHPFTKGH